MEIDGKNVSLWSTIIADNRKCKV